MRWLSPAHTFHHTRRRHPMCPLWATHRAHVQQTEIPRTKAPLRIIVYSVAHCNNVRKRWRARSRVVGLRSPFRILFEILFIFSLSSPPLRSVLAPFQAAAAVAAVAASHATRRDAHVTYETVLFMNNKHLGTENGGDTQQRRRRRYTHTNAYK